MFGGGGGGAPRPVVTQAPPPPVVEDPTVQNKRAARLTQARFQRGFLSTIQSQQGGLGATVATAGPNPTGSVTKLG